MSNGEIEPLSERELELVQLLDQGLSNREIAQTLFISPNTVKVHLRNIYTKLRVSSRTEATMVALRQGLIEIELPGSDDAEAEQAASDETETLSSHWTGLIGAWDAGAEGMGGWTISEHHAYDPSTGYLYLGDGGRRAASASEGITRADADT